MLDEKKPVSLADLDGSYLLPPRKEGELRSYARLGDGFESEAALKEMARRGLSEIEDVMRVMAESAVKS